jgi:outer membrane lipoprotein-sorting protein
MKLLKQAMVVLAISVLVLGVSGCKEKGSAEKAGEKIDQSMEKAADKANDLLGK